jgi:hypothetical protein
MMSKLTEKQHNHIQVKSPMTVGGKQTAMLLAEARMPSPRQYFLRGLPGAYNAPQNRPS